MRLEIISGLLLSLVTSLYAEGACEDNIYLAYGQRGEVACEFEGYDVIGWINGGGDHEETSPFIYVEESVVRGRGHDSGNYSMYPNGSLIINHVTFENHYNYTVLLVPSVGLNEYLTVEVKVYVKPFPEYPVVNEVTDQQFIVQDIDRSTGVLTCAMSGVWPAVGLEWVYPEDMMSMESKSTVTGNKDSTSNTLLNSTFTVHGPLSGSITVQCVVTGELSKVLYSRTTIHLLIQRDFPVVNGLVGLHHVVLEVTPEAEISCSMNGVSQGISLEWLVITPAASNEIHLEDTRSQTSNEDGTADVMLNSSLSVTSNSIDRVTLRCQVTGESADDFQQVTTVELLIARSTNFPVVNGLVGLHHVVLEVTPEAEISCSMNGVSQGISLEWLVITPAASNEIHLEDTRSQTSNEDGTADVMLNSSLSVTSNSIDRVTLRCQVTGKSAADFQQVTTVELLIARSTNFPIVNGHSSGQHLVVHLNREDELNCTVNGVSEDVSLEWVITTPDISDKILLEDKHSKTTNEDGTFNLQLNTHLSILSQSVQHLTMECRVSGDNADQYKAVTMVEVLVVQSTARIFDHSEVIRRWRWSFAFIIILNVIVIFLVLCKKHLVKIAKKHVAPEPENPEDIEMKAANHRGSHESLLELGTQTTAADLKEMYTTIISLLNNTKHSTDAGSSSHSSDSAIA